MTEAILLVVCVALAGAVVALAVSLRGLRDQLRHDVGALRTELDRRLAGMEAEWSAARGFETAAGAPSSTNGTAATPLSGEGDEEYVITRLGTGEDGPVDPPDARLFADLVLRESVVKAASFAHGVRRGFSPANRNRIWFEMRREVKRARKQRKADEREALREWKARQRAAERDGQREGQRDGQRDGQREDDAA